MYYMIRKGNKPIFILFRSQEVQFPTECYKWPLEETQLPEHQADIVNFKKRIHMELKSKSVQEAKAFMDKVISLMQWQLLSKILVCVSAVESPKPHGLLSWNFGCVIYHETFYGGKIGNWIMYYIFVFPSKVSIPLSYFDCFMFTMQWWLCFLN